MAGPMEQTPSWLEFHCFLSCNWSCYIHPQGKMKCKILARCASDLQVHFSSTCTYASTFNFGTFFVQQSCTCKKLARSMQVLQGTCKFLTRFARIACTIHSQVFHESCKTCKKTNIFRARILQTWTCKNCG